MSETERKVQNLLEAVKKFQNFTQLAKYNIGCILQAITPPHSGWKEAINYLVKNGGVDVLVSILKKQKNGQSEIVVLLTKTLSQLNASAEGAKAVLTGGGIESAFESILRTNSNPSTDAVYETAKLVQSASVWDAPAVVENGGVSGLIRVIEKYAKNQKLVQQSINTLEVLTQSPEGINELIQQHGIPAMLSTMGPQTLQKSVNHLDECFTMLSRACYVPENVEYIAACGATETVISSLKSIDFEDNSTSVAKRGGKLLRKLANKSVTDAVERLEKSRDSKAIALLSHLADAEQIGQIVESNGLQNLVVVLQNTNLSNDELENAARCIAKLTGNTKYIQKLVDCDAVNVLVATLKRDSINERSITIILDILFSITLEMSSNAVKMEDKKNECRTVFSLLDKRSDSKRICLKCLRYIALQKKYPEILHNEKDLVTFIIKAMKNHHTSQKIQSESAKLLHVLLSVEIKSKSSKERFLKNVVSSNAVKYVFQALEGFSESLAVADPCISIIEVLVSKFGPNRVLQASNIEIQDCCQNFANIAILHIDAHPVRSAVHKLLDVYVQEEFMVSKMKFLESWLNPSGEKIDSESLFQVLNDLQFLTGCTISEKLSSLTLENGFLALSFQIIEKIGKKYDLDGLNEVLERCFLFQYNFIYSNPSLRGTVEKIVQELDGVSVVAQTIKINPSIEVTVGLNVLKEFSKMPALAPSLVLKGIAEPLITLLRVQTDDSMVVIMTLSLLIDLACSPENTLKLIKKGVFRPILNAVRPSHSNSKNVNVVKKVLRLLILLTKANAGVKALQRTRPLKTLNYIGEIFVTESNIQSLYKKVVSLVVGTANVESTLDSLAAIATSETVDLLNAAEIIDSVRSLVVNRENSKLLISKAACENTILLMSKLIVESDDEVRNAVISTSSWSLGFIANEIKFPEESQFGPWMVYSLRSKPSIAIVNAASMCMRTKQNADQLMQNGIVEALVELIEFSEIELIPHVFRSLGAIAVTSSEFHDKVSSSQVIGKGFERLGYLQHNKNQSATSDFFDLLSILCFECPRNLEQVFHFGNLPNLLEYIEFEFQLPDRKEFVISTLKFVLTACNSSPQSLKSIRTELQGGNTFLQSILKREEYSDDEDIALHIFRLIEALNPPALMENSNSSVVFTQQLKENLNLLLDQNSSSEEILVLRGKMASFFSPNVKETQVADEMLAEITSAVSRFCESPDAMLASTLCTSIDNYHRHIIIEEGKGTEINYSNTVSGFYNTITLLNNQKISKYTETIAVKSLGILSKIPSLNASQLVDDDFDIANSFQTIIQRYPHNIDILDKAVTCLSSVAGSEGVQLICKTSSIPVLRRAIRLSNSEDTLKSTVDSALSTVSSAVATHGEKITRNRSEGTKLLYEIMETVTECDEGVEENFSTIATSSNGPNQLLEIMSESENNVKLNEKIIKSMQDVPEFEISSQKEIRGIVNAINCASTSTEEEDSTYEERIEEMFEFGVKLMEKVAESSSLTKGALEEGGVDALLGTLVKTRVRSTSLLCARVLRKMSSHGHIEVQQRFSELQVASTIAGALREYEEEDDFQKDALALLQSISGGRTEDVDVGVDESLLFSMNLETNNGIRGEEELLWESKMQHILDASLVALQSSLDFTQLMTDDGVVYYVNKKDQSSSWDVPAPIQTMQDYLDNFDYLMANRIPSHDYKPIFNSGKLRILTEHFCSSSENEKCVLLSLKLLLLVLCSNKQRVLDLQEYDGLKALLTCIEFFLSNTHIVGLIIKCWNICVAADRTILDMLDDRSAGLLVRSMIIHKNTQEVCIDCIKLLANATYGSVERIQSVCDNEVIAVVEDLMQTYRSDAEALAKILVLLANIAHGGDELRIQISDRCADELVLILQDHYDNYSLSLQAVRTIGILVYCEHNIARFIEEHATGSIVEAARKHFADTELVSLTLDVIANLSSHNDDRKYEVIMEEKAPEFVAELLTSIDSESYANSALHATANLASHPECAEIMVKKNCIFAVINLIQEYDWDADVVETAIDSLNNLIEFCPTSVVQFIIDEGGVQAIVSSCIIHKDNLELCKAGLTTVAMMLSRESGIKNLMSIDGANTIMRLYERQKDKTLTIIIFQILSQLGVTDEYAITVGQACIPQLAQAIQNYENDLLVLKAAIKTLTHMTLHDGNLSQIVQQNGIALLVDIICKHPDQLDVLEEAIHSIDHIAICSPEMCMIVVQESGKKALSLLVETFEGSNDQREEKIADSCKHTLMTMRALEHQAQELQKTKTMKCGSKRILSHRGPNNGQSGLEEAQNLKMLEAFENMSSGLTKGKHVYVRFKGGKRSKCYLKVNKEKNALIFLPPKTKGKIELLIKFIDIDSVVRGPAFSETVQNLKKLHRYIGLTMKSNEVYNVIFRSPGDRNHWFEMIRIARKAAHILKGKLTVEDM